MDITDSLSQCEGLGEQPFGLLELGSNSLKFYLVGIFSKDKPSPAIKTNKFPWRVAHEYFMNRALSEAGIFELIETIKGIEAYAEGISLSSMLAVATGVFRELENIEDIAARVMRETGVRIRVITGADEARLMARDFNHEISSEPALLIDLGGATMEWALFRNGVSNEWGSLPLGAIRNEYRFHSIKGDATRYFQECASYCDEELIKLPCRGRIMVVATGGTAKAAAKCAGNDVVPIETIRILMEKVIREGPPKNLRPARQAVFLPGLAILWRVLVRCNSPTFSYGKACVRDGMAGRLIRLLGTHRRKDLHATLLLHSSDIIKKDR